MLLAKLIFWLSAFGLFYIYLGYPLLIWLLARVRPRPVKKGECSDAVSVVISAYNEEAVIARKLQNLLSLQDSARIRQILVGSDGSSDRTAAMARSVPDPRVRVFEFAERRGKASVLNDLIPQCSSAIVVLTDARQEIHPDALGALLANFADASVGVVSGELVFLREQGASVTEEGLGAYWSYEKFIRKSESCFASVPGATGALYAIRKELFRPIPPATVLDDVAIPMQAVVRGARCVFEGAALVFDRASRTPDQEAIRKRRTLAGNVQLLGLYPGWLLPWRNPVWLQFVSHKVARLLSPLFLITLFVLNLGLLGVDSPGYIVFLVLQCAFHLMAAAGWMMSRLGLSCSVAGLPFMFMALNLATLAGLADALMRKHKPAWDRTAHGTLRP